VVAIKERLLTLLARAGSTQPKLKVCLQVIRDHERTIQALQQQLEDQRKSSDSTPRCHSVPGSDDWPKISSEEISGKAQAGQTSSSALMSSRVKQQQEHKGQLHHGHARLGSHCKGMVDEEEEVKRGNQASNTPSSLFPWPKPKFRIKTTAIEQYHLQERELSETSTERSVSALVHESESTEARAKWRPATRPPPQGAR
jgi:hypothetical protein